MQNSLREISYVRIFEIATRRRVWSKISWLSRTQWADLQIIRELQIKKLRRLLHHVYENVPFYRKVFKAIGISPADIKSLSDFSRIPPLRKHDVQVGYPSSLLARNFDHSGGFEDATGGTTGGPTRYYVGREAAAFRAANAIRNQHWYDFHYGDSNALIWGAQRDLTTNSMFFGSLQRLFLNRIELNAWRMSKASMNRFASQIKKQNSEVLVGYASGVALFAEHVMREGIELRFRKGVILSGEQVTSKERERISTAFESPVFDRYGSREFGAIAHHCSENHGLHINAESLLIEEGESIGDAKKFLITDLNNYSTPFIRYDIGDTGVLSEKQCSCGRGLPLIEKIEGRVTNFILTADGKYVNGIVFPHILRTYPDIIEFYAEQDSVDEVKLHLVVRKPLDAATRLAISNEFLEFLGSTKIRFIEVDSLPKSSSGKKLLVYSKLLKTGSV